MTSGTSGPAAGVLVRSLDLAHEHRCAGRNGQAEFLYSQALGIEPGNVDALLGLATLRHDQGAHSEAETLLLTAQREAPADERLAPALNEVRKALGSSYAEADRRRSLTERLAGRFGRPLLSAVVQRPRVWKYRALSDCARISGTPILDQPALFLGRGELVFGRDVHLGYVASPLFYSGYCHVEVSSPHSRIELGDRVAFNNNAMLKSEGPGIRIASDSIFGAHVEVFDSDFHDLHPERRHNGTQRMAPVEIAENVFVGMSVKILKGVTVGADSVIGAGAVVTRPIPAGVIAAGNPARVVREL